MYLQKQPQFVSYVLVNKKYIYLTLVKLLFLDNSHVYLYIDLITLLLPKSGCRKKGFVQRLKMLSFSSECRRESYLSEK
jgi:hypothetical protein